MRFAAVDGMLTPGRALEGRGAYTCRSRDCFERAVARRAFRRTLQTDVNVGPELARIYTGWSNG